MDVQHLNLDVAAAERQAAQAEQKAEMLEAEALAAKMAARCSAGASHVALLADGNPRVSLNFRSNVERKF